MRWPSIRPLCSLVRFTPLYSSAVRYWTVSKQVTYQNYKINEINDSQPNIIKQQIYTKNLSRKKQKTDTVYNKISQT